MTTPTSTIRKYSQADFLRHRLNLLAQFDPCDEVSLTVTSGATLVDYENSDQGVTGDDRWDAGFEASYRPHPRVGLRASYQFDYIRLFQKQGGSSWESVTSDFAHQLRSASAIVRTSPIGDFSTWIAAAP